MIHCNIIEGEYADLNVIHDDFCNDYLWSNDLSNPEIRRKYNLTVKEFREFSEQVKKEYGFTRRPINRVQGKYYYRHRYGWVIQKTIQNRIVYFGYVPTELVAQRIVELCKKVEWDVDVSRNIVKNWKHYID